MYSRVVGYLLFYAPNATALATLKDDIASCDTADQGPLQALYNLGEFYVKNLLLIFRKTRGRTPVPSDHPSRPSFEVAKSQVMEDLQSTPRNHSDAKLAALARDNFRCMVTGRVDLSSCENGLIAYSPGEFLCCAQCAYIFPDSLGNIRAGGRGDKEHQVATAWMLLKRFGYKDVYNELTADTSKTNLHRLENIMTLEYSIHDLFDKMSLWFEAQSEPNVYRVAMAPRLELAHSGLGVPATVHFTAHSDSPLPSPKYLAIHAACCRVAHMSGAAEYFDMILRDMEELQVLSEDGASADVLAYALHRLEEPDDPYRAIGTR
ncbi:hypothetical protein BD310DRAFT_831335 [Dichomitus squalens]|uniref:HNH nuclease domain-containing protein n=1 Tax=Dichomitus squalens TaxID=114155 RepID=A0A4Q9PDE7_9APHY|nr:hypothetical protein BD310DRAFT_831335 [Dichomitus squalens]